MQGNLIAHFVDERSDRLRCPDHPGGDHRRHRRGRGAGGRARGPVAAAGGLRAAVSRQRRAAGLADRGAVAIALLTADRRRHGGGRPAPRLFARLGRRDGGVGAAAADCRWALETRTVVALLCGPLVGIAVHLVALARAGRLIG